jgi:hypothetical protein
MSGADKKPDPDTPDETAAPEPPPGTAGDLPELDDEARAILDEALSDADAVAEGAPDDDRQGGLDEVDIRDLLRSAMAPPPGAVAPDLLRGVQRKIRRRSRGKFYGDGWSTASSPRSTYLVTSILMLALIALVFLVLIPWGSGAVP